MTTLKPTTAAALAATLALVATYVAAPSATATEGSRSVAYRGTTLIGNCTMTSLEIDENGVWHAECDGIPPSLLIGDFTGYDYSRITFTYDPATGEVDGWIDECFAGAWTGDGSDNLLRGTMWREGPVTSDTDLDDGIGVVFEQKIIGGTGDFAGSRGDFHATGVAAPSGIGFGGYSGHWIRGKANADDDPVPVCGLPSDLPPAN